MDCINKGQEKGNVTLTDICLKDGENPLVYIQFNKDGRKIERWFRLEALIQMVDTWEKSTTIIDAKTGDKFSDYLLPD